MVDRIAGGKISASGLHFVSVGGTCDGRIALRYAAS